MQFSPQTSYLVPLNPKHSPRTLFSNTLILHSSLNMSGQVLHPRKQSQYTSKYNIIYVLERGTAPLRQISGHQQMVTHYSNAHHRCVLYSSEVVNLQNPNVIYSCRTATLTLKVAFCIFIQQIQVPNILNMVYTLRFFLFKMQFVS